MRFQAIQETPPSGFYLLAVFFDIISADKRFLRICMEIETQDNIEKADNDEQRSSSREQKSDHFFYLLSCVLSHIPPFGKGRSGGIFVMRTSPKNLPCPLFAKEGYFRDN
jgi:hypothetical protein